MNAALKLAGILAVMLLLAALGASAATVDVSPPQNITGTGDASGNGYYERDPELLMASGGTWYLIYSRSQTDFTAGGNPDGLKYDTYLQTSTDNGATWSAASMVLNAGAISANASFRSATICEADGKIWVIAANVEGLEGDIYATTYSGGTWSAQAMIFDGTYNTGAFHVSAVAEADDIRLFYGIQNEGLGVGFIKYRGDTDTWDAAVTAIGTSAGHQIPRVIKEGGSYYLVSTDWSQILFASTTTPDVTPWPAAAAITTAPSDGASSDPCILRYGASDGTDDLIVFHAPWYPDDSQPQEYVYSTDGGATWSGSLAFTDCSHDTQLSWDMMPRAYLKDSNNIISFYGMEHRGVNRGQADIVAVTWDISATIGNAHYTSIQDGVDNATVGDVVSVQAGTYVEQVEITKDLTLDGAGEDVSIIECPEVLTKSFLIGTSTYYYPVVLVHDAGDVTAQDLTVDGLGRGNAYMRFTGVGYFNAGGAIQDCTVRNIRDTPYDATNHTHMAIAVNDRDGVSRSMTVSGNTIYEFERVGMYVYSAPTTPLALDISANEIIGAGPTSAIDYGQMGMQIGSNYETGITGAVTGNSISGIYYTGSMAASLWVLRAYLDVIGNTITGGQGGIYYFGCSGQISGNTVEVSSASGYAEGLYVNDPPVKVPAIPVEPEEPGGDSGFGLLGFAPTILDIDIVGNRFTCTGGFTGGGFGIDLYAGYPDYYGQGGYDSLDVTITDNVVTGFDYGVYMSWCGDPIENPSCNGGRFVNLIARNDSIYGNGFGMYSDVTSPVIDATACWWGDDSGPFHPTLNPGGGGNEVSDNVLFDPWLGKSTSSENIVCVPDPQYLTGPAPTNTVDVNYLGGGSGLVFAYSVSFTWDTSKATLDSVSQGNLLSSQGPTWFLVSGTGNSRTVDCTLMGAYAGVPGPGTMFTLHFTGVGEGSSPIDVTVLEVRDNANAPLTGFLEDDGELIVDVIAPSVTGVFIDNQTLSHTDDWVKNGDTVCITATVADASGVSEVYADLSAIGGGMAVPPDYFDGTAATWCPVVVSGTPPGGTVMVTIYAVDTFGGNTGSGFDTITADNVAPDPISDLAAAQQKAGNGTDGTTGITLTFTAPVDAYPVEVEVWRAGYGAYPEYDDGGGSVPPAPLDYTSVAPPWFLADPTVSGGTDEPTARDFWHYVGFVKDIAWNVSAVSNQTGGTLNYHLGDVTDGTTPGNGDNIVNTVDFSALSGSYWKHLVLGDPVNYLDVGPTADYSTNALPTTDNFINFEDLMMLALNCGVVTLASDEVVRPENPALTLAVDDVLGGTLRARLMLVGNRQSVKGLHAAVSYDPGALEFVGVTQGGLVTAQASPTFFEDLGGTGKVQVDLAAILSSSTLRGSGEVAVIEFRVIGTGNTTPILTAVDMRDRANKSVGRKIEPRADDTIAAAAAAPEVAFGAYPNPFSGTTEIAFSVPVAGEVSLRVYDVSGRLVRSLVEGSQAAGVHRVVWDGRTGNGARTAPGVYLAVVRIGGDEKASKMFLLP